MKAPSWMFTEYYRPGPNGTFRKPVQFGNEVEIIVRDSHRRFLRVERPTPRQRASGRVPTLTRSQLP